MKAKGYKPQIANIMLKSIANAADLPRKIRTAGCHCGFKSRIMQRENYEQHFQKHNRA